MLASNGTPEDPWVIEYTGQDRTEYVPVEFIGEQDVKHRKVDFDLEVGLCGKNNLGLSEDEEGLLANLLACADSLYKPPTAVTYAAANGYVDEENLTAGWVRRFGGDSVLMNCCAGFLSALGQTFLCWNLI